MNLDRDRFTPGVLDGYARFAFTTGACTILAVALHDATGWPVVAVTDAHNVCDGRAGGGSALHWMVRRPDGMLIDVDGGHREEDIVEQYAGDADDGEAACGLSSREDCMAWFEEQGCPIPLSLATTFVDTVIASAKEPVEPEAPKP